METLQDMYVCVCVSVFLNIPNLYYTVNDPLHSDHAERRKKKVKNSPKREYVQGNTVGYSYNQHLSC